MKGQVLFYGGDNDVRYAFVFWEGELGGVLVGMGTGGHEEKSLI
ncbi:hypothetical protein [Bartonella grahamii]|nr:hypothetical protein [Bartonella grahamii]